MESAILRFLLTFLANETRDYEDYVDQNPTVNHDSFWYGLKSFALNFVTNVLIMHHLNNANKNFDVLKSVGSYEE